MRIKEKTELRLGSERVKFKKGCHEGHELEYPREKDKNC